MAVCVFAAAAYSAVLRLHIDWSSTLVYAPYHVIPDGQARQATWLKSKALKSHTLLYIATKIDYWRFWTWQRCLYPDYLLTALSSSQVPGPEFRAVRNTYGIDHVLIEGNAKPKLDLKWQVTAPPEPGTPPLRLGELAR